MEFKRLLYIGLLILNSVAADYRSVYDLDLYESVLDPEQCQIQLQFLASNPLGSVFLDASAKPPPGILTGNINDLGDYYQCLDINTFVDSLETDVQGKYCTITVNNFTLPSLPDIPDIPWPTLPSFVTPSTENGEVEAPSTENGEEVDEENEEVDEIPIADQYDAMRRYALGIAGVATDLEPRIFPMTINQIHGMKLGICLPKVCTAREAVDFFMNMIPGFSLSYNEFYCRLPDDKLFTAADIVAIVIFSFIGLITIMSTTYDLCHIFWLKRDPKSANVFLRCFSIYTNTRRFLTFNKVPGALECIDSIRSISMLWVVIGHTYAFSLLGYIHNMLYTVQWLSQFSSTWITSAPITVDTFFCMSGILVVYTTIGKIKRSRFIRTVHLFYINRLLRMFPLLAVMVLVQASLINHMSDGPFWMNISQQVQNCRTYWWSALLHVQNYVNPLEICIPQTWYLSVDVQLYFFCPLILFWLFGRERFAWLALIAIVLASLVSSSAYSFYHGFSAALGNPLYMYRFADYVKLYYFNTLARAPPFFVGMIYGYLLHLFKDKQLRIAKVYVALLWITSVSMMLFCIFSIHPVMQPDHTLGFFDNFLNAYMRAIWACALGWIIFACVHGYGGPVNWFLSLQMWKLPARLSYATYLVHVTVIMLANGSWVKTHYFSEGDTIYRFFSDVSITFIVAFVLCVTIDAPFSTLQKLLTGGRKRPEKPKTESTESIVDIEPRVIKTRF